MIWLTQPLTMYLPFLYIYIRRTETKGTLVFYFILPKAHYKAISGVTSSCSNPSTTLVVHTEDDIVSLLSESAAIPH